MPCFHISSSGKLVKCKNDPCKLHAGSDFQAENLKEAQKIAEKAISNSSGESLRKKDNWINYRKYSSVSNEFRGNKDIRIGYYDDWNDPDLLYNGYEFNYYDIESAMYDEYVDGLKEDKEEGLIDSDEPTDEGFNHYIQDNATGYLEDTIAGGYFKEGSKSWHDNYK